MIQKTKMKGNRMLCATAALMVIMVIITASAPAVFAEAPFELTVRQICFAHPAAADDTFTYRLKALSLNAPMPKGSTADGYIFKITGSGSVSLGPFEFGKNDSYFYEIYQITQDTPRGYTYDKRVYTVEIYADASLVINKTVKNEKGEKEDEIIFENVYRAEATDPKLMTDPPVIKTVSGNPGYNSVFEFKLTAQNASQPMPAGSAGGVKTIRITGSGRGEFGIWSYDKAGTYYYTVYEINTGENNYSYDTAVYKITHTIKNENGQLVLSRVVTNELNKAVTSMIFNNRYTGGGTPPAPGKTDPIKPPETTTTHTPSPGKTDPTDPSDPAEPKIPVTEPAGEPKQTETTETGAPAQKTDPTDPRDPTDQTGPGGTGERLEPTLPAGMSRPAQTTNPDIPGAFPGIIQPPGIAEPLKPAQIYRPGINSPKTGDETENTLYFILFATGALLAAGAAIYMITGVKRGGSR